MIKIMTSQIHYRSRYHLHKLGARMKIKKENITFSKVTKSQREERSWESYENIEMDIKKI